MLHWLTTRARWQALTLRRLRSSCMKRWKLETLLRHLKVQHDLICNKKGQMVFSTVVKQVHSPTTQHLPTRYFLQHLFSRNHQGCQDRRRSSTTPTTMRPSRPVPPQGGLRSHTIRFARPSNLHHPYFAPYRSTRSRLHHHRTRPKARVASSNKRG